MIIILHIVVDIDDNEVKSIVKEIKEFTNKYSIKPSTIRYIFNADTYDKTYIIYCTHMDKIEDPNYFEDEINFCQQLCSKYELDNVYFDNAFDLGQGFSVQVEAIQTFKYKDVIK